MQVSALPPPTYSTCWGSWGVYHIPRIRCNYITQSKERVVILECGRGGVYRNSLICENSWMKHLGNIFAKEKTEHPAAHCFTETEVLLVKEMTNAGLKPRQILKRLRRSNPEVLSTPKRDCNIKAKLRQGPSQSSAEKED
ncbi:hypothetical protein Vadar_028976 [Vaccinium darrowii]|nr:hypothetical protein Vadar_028976 [Vaccinium darrowii]